MPCRRMAAPGHGHAVAGGAPGNHRARALYLRRGFAEVGLRRGYYPAANGGREDAIVMRLDLLGAAA
jgi:ribosomal protein S18 acetylase RimI-like enzyme